MMVRVIKSGVRVEVSVRVRELVAVAVGNVVVLAVDVGDMVLVEVDVSVFFSVGVFEGRICMLGVNDAGSGVLVETRVGLLVSVRVGVKVVVATQAPVHAVGIAVARN
jgi:hypothetical protein